MRTTNWDAVIAASPLNRQASIVRDGVGEPCCEPDVPADYPRWLAPPKMKPITSLRGPGIDTALDMIGLRAGSMVVLGIAEGTNPKKGAVWVCRCDCGYYEGRKAKALTGPFAHEIACITCTRLAKVRIKGSEATTPQRRAQAADRLDSLAGSK